MRPGPWNARHLVRLIASALAIGLAATGALCLFPWLKTVFTPAVARASVIGFLTGLEVGYGVALAAALVGVAVSIGVLYAKRHERRRSRLAVRVLFLSICCLFAFALAEAGAAVRRAAANKARSPAGDPVLPTHFAEAEQGGDVTLAVLGESSAFGMPFEPWFSVGKIVAWQLGKAMPERRFRAEILAIPGDTLEGQHRNLATLKHKPGALIVYCGHNEFVAHIPTWHTVDYYADDQALPLFWGLGERARRFSPFCGLINDAADKLRVSQVPTARFHPPLVFGPAYTEAEFATMLGDFRRRLEVITSYAEQVGAIPILVIPPSNDARFDPNRSFLSRHTTRAERDAFAREFTAARSLEDVDRTKAMERYRALLARQPGFAETHYRMACLLEEAGKWDEAYEHYIAARDLDGLPMRCLTAFQQAYRDVAQRHDCILVDGQALFHALGPHGLLDDHLFHDGMHPSLLGHVSLAQAILAALHERGAFDWSREAPAPAIDPALCAAQFGLAPTDWKRLCERGFMFYYGTASVRHDRRQRLAKRDAFKAAVARIEAGEAAENVGLPNIGIPPARLARTD
jgi:lysophospholipase L1-like esterase